MGWLGRKLLVGNYQPDIEENTRVSGQQVAIVDVILDQKVRDTFSS